VTEIANGPGDFSGPGQIDATGDRVLILRPYPVHVGQKLFIEAGPRRGDWEVIGVGDRQIRLRCPVSHKEIDCDWFCYVVTEATDRPWPQAH
jgi:hypothetical protein